MSDKSATSLQFLFETLSVLLKSGSLQLWADLLRILSTILPDRGAIGSYEVTEHESQLELRGKSGRNAIYTKRQVVKFLQDNVIGYQDDAWGDGEIFAEYQCTPGVAVDRYVEGNRHHVLISLRKIMNRGDVQEFHIQRRIRGGFTKITDDLQVEVNHNTKNLSMTVLFPESRWPKQCWLIEQKARRSKKLDQNHFSYLPDKRLMVTWNTDRPRLFEMYILRWEW